MRSFMMYCTSPFVVVICGEIKTQAWDGREIPGGFGWKS
jgi:hypothetical protein